PPSTLASGSARHQSSLTTPTTSTVRSPLQYFLFKAPAHPQIYTLSLHDALPIFNNSMGGTDFRNSSTAANATITNAGQTTMFSRSEEHTSELQSPCNLVCRLLLEKKNASATVTPQQTFLVRAAGETKSRLVAATP